MRYSNFSSLSVGLVVVGLLGAVPASAGAPPAVLRPTLVLGAALPTATGVKVSSDGAEWALPGGARLVAGPDTELRVIGSPQELVLAARRKVPTYTVVLKSGSLRVIVPDAGTTAVIVAAPRKSSVLVASGEASVRAGEEVAVANHRGSTSVGAAGEPFRTLPSGMVEVVGGGRRPLLGSPSALRVPSVIVAHDATVELGAFDFEPVSGASAYRVELRDTASGRLVARTETHDSSVPAGLASVPPGAYTLRVAAVDSAGFEGALPHEQPLHVLGLDLPVGAFVDAAGVVHFAPGVRLAFEHPEGVEMSFGHLGDFTAAPPSIELLRSEPRLVTLRAAGSTTASELWLVPRKAHASIEFGPRAPHWPGAPLEISVRVDDLSGEPLSWSDLTPSVSLGVEPVALAFKRDGEWLRGVLPAPSGPGPWVVRVEVKDQHGLELGRDFVEIADRR